MKIIVIALLIVPVLAHMGISIPKSLDQAKVNDVYRYPNPKEPCHGAAATAKYTWIWTPKSSGACEIYQNCWTTEPTTLTMSNGAAHDGGPCKLYECSGAVTMPPCERMSLPDSFGTCKVIASSPDCTLKGTMAGRTGGGSGGTTPAPAPAPAKSIRCGSTWTIANSQCGKVCAKDEDCGAEKCFADLSEAPCTSSTPTSEKCVSIKPYILDAFCAGTGCATEYKDYCAKGVPSKQTPGLTAVCQLYVAKVGDTFTTIADKWDTEEAKLKAENPNKIAEPGVVFEIPGDCTTARKDQEQSAAVRSSNSIMATVGSIVFILVAMAQ